MTQLQNPAVPNLPLAPFEYDPRYQEQFTNILRLYFNRLEVITRNILAPSGGQFVSYPFGAFSSLLDQTAASTTVAYAITFNSTDINQSVEVANNSRIVVLYSGIYNLQFSIQFVNTDTQIHDVDVWAAINGTNVANSNSRFSVPNRHGGVDGHLIAALNLFLTMQAGDYVELYWHTTNTAVSVEYLSSGSSPTRPATPSVIATMAFVSSIPE